MNIRRSIPVIALFAFPSLVACGGGGGSSGTGGTGPLPPTKGATPPALAPVPTVTAPPTPVGATQVVMQNIRAATGGTLTLPNGSSLVVQPNALARDIAVQMSFVPSSTAAQPQNPAFQADGAAVHLFAFTSNPSLSTATYIRKPYGNLRRQDVAPGTPPPIALNVTYPSPNGSYSASPFALPIVQVYSSGGTIDLSGPYDSTGNTHVAYSISVPDFSKVLPAGAFGTHIDTFLAFLKAKTSAFTQPGLQYYDPATSTWGAVPASLTTPTHPLLLLHGILSSTMDTFNDGPHSTNSTDPTDPTNPLNPKNNTTSSVPEGFNTVEAFRENGGYDAIFGYNYDWLDTPENVAPTIASAINALNLPNLDIVAHSYGTIQAMALVPLLNPNIEIQNMILFNGPLNGSIVLSDYAGALETHIANNFPTNPLLAGAISRLSPIAAAINYLSIYTPNNTRLQNIETAMMAAPNAPQRVIKVSADQPNLRLGPIFELLTGSATPPQAFLPGGSDDIVSPVSALYDAVQGMPTHLYQPQKIDVATIPAPGSAPVSYAVEHIGTVNNAAIEQVVAQQIHVELNNGDPVTELFPSGTDSVYLLKGKPVQAWFGVASGLPGLGINCQTASFEPGTINSFYQFETPTFPCAEFGPPPLADGSIIDIAKVPSTVVSATPTDTVSIDVTDASGNVTPDAYTLDLFTLPDTSYWLEHPLQSPGSLPLTPSGPQVPPAPQSIPQMNALSSIQLLEAFKSASAKRNVRFIGPNEPRFASSIPTKWKR